MILLFHILISFLSIASLIAGIFVGGRYKAYAQSVFLPSASLVVISGFGLVLQGASITHACVSGTLTLATLFALRGVLVTQKL